MMGLDVWIRDVEIYIDNGMCRYWIEWFWEVGVQFVEGSIVAVLWRGLTSRRARDRPTDPPRLKTKD